MPRFSLRTLLILLAVGPMVLAWAWFGVKALADYRARQARAAQLKMIETAALGVARIGPGSRHPNPDQ